MTRSPGWISGRYSGGTWTQALDPSAVVARTWRSGSAASGNTSTTVTVGNVMPGGDVSSTGRSPVGHSTHAPTRVDQERGDEDRREHPACVPTDLRRGRDDVVGVRTHRPRIRRRTPGRGPDTPSHPVPSGSALAG